ncbi:aquaporin-like protein [Fusarium tricinctum]|uniref:Aquaporin-like protein n=1 Tax=Fusarium tricinctum TaxID=61284 RepID=A0A8K0RNB8_9HYPO|nr:aquaporin-like protein [Fusarium tricinctum]
MSSTADIHGTPVRNGHNGHHHHSRTRSHSNRNRNSNSRTLYHEKHQRSHLSDVQKHLVAASGEFAGTFLFLYFAYAGNIVAVLQEPMAARDGSLANSTLMYIAMAYGFSLLVNVWAFFRISGGLFNPAVTFGLCLAGQLPWIRALFLFPAQITAAMCAGGLVDAMFPGNASLANTVLGPNTSVVQGVFLEMFFTAQLTFVVLMLAAEKSRDTFLAPVGIGLALFVALIPGVFVTGGSANPVRSFGCAVGAREFPSYHWIYWIGPLLGAALAAGYFRLVKMMHYEEANPGQDSPVDV